MATGTVTPPTATQLAEEVKRLAAEYPDKQAACQYFESDTGEPCCIVGHALAKFGYTYADAKRQWNTGVDVGELFHKGVIALGDGESYDLLDGLREVQSAQDDGLPWGEAVKALSE
ncbi:hypothetical protein P755_gp083 [Mycobacterium phage Quink]|uniref:Uncharacterized protein n=1 Tax=Mycobacterium phage Cjw1 TaxID=2907830 RepID=Q857T1_9CAUD|nr:gp81 [Mycobacterium phage Cjw1]YP_008409473.1 hypothetical protein DRDREY_80 [Mycobacterium phage DrDrey]YP_008531159.1 hypothetical protein P755_gp083 [Mycobacterium phage Quink]AEL21822.1 hypothetical protein ELPH10_80 [Mycobacterium phage Elph10]AXC35927.1 hypothetical protein SEA_ADNAMA_84 [Mycobacterium phage Adnama]AAN01695.1 hypothetical protein PBI_CJW1_80 [Mycobacterium phage Cjw1]AGT13751.1 hypothetical protein DRDREY_80 [Mycobacterium phage DrDrey]AGU92494.1 hypothetical protei